jgi:lipopolysaccharide/colanic/teichoic acid biosynthesis glycosyltransferase
LRDRVGCPDGTGPGEGDAGQGSLLSGGGREQTGEVRAVLAACQQAGGPVALPAAAVETDTDLLTLPGLADDAFGPVVVTWSGSLKRLFDVVLSAAALVVLAPVFLLVAAVVKFTDGGPVFFVQRRVGLHGQIIHMLKFRSMVVNAEALRPRLELLNESNGPVFKMQLDPRVTAIGRLLRKYSIDELPQLINILVGDMSVVGPRPSLPGEVARYQPWQYRRFSARPGLTCFWQVSPQRYQISFEEWMRLDLSYVDQWSLRLDFILILRTFAVVLGGTGK